MASYKQGMTGSGVKSLQAQLNKLGAGLTADGVFGSATKTAVIKFQRDNNLAADGVAGAATLSALERRINEKIGEKMKVALDAIAKLPEVQALEKLL